MNLGHRLPEPRHDRQAAVHLIEHGRSCGPEKLSLPEQHELAPHVGLVSGPLARKKVVGVELLKALSHPPELGADGSPLGLARMSGEHEFHRKPVEHLLHVISRRAERLQFGDPGGERFAERVGMKVSLALTKHADPLPVLGDVGEIEEDAERAGHDGRLLLIERLDPGGERGLRVVAALSPLAGQTASSPRQPAIVATIQAGTMSEKKGS